MLSRRAAQGLNYNGYAYPQENSKFTLSLLKKFTNFCEKMFIFFPASTPQIFSVIHKP